MRVPTRLLASDPALPLVSCANAAKCLLLSLPGFLVCVPGRWCCLPSRAGLLKWVHVRAGPGTARSVDGRGVRVHCCFSDSGARGRGKTEKLLG